MTVLVVSPIKVLAEALIVLLENHGFRAHSDPGQPADLALIDLVSSDNCPPPPPIPAFALNSSDKTASLLALGYRHCFDVGEPTETLVHMLRSVLPI